MTRIRTAEQIRHWKATARQKDKLSRPFRQLKHPKRCDECRHESTMFARKAKWCFVCEVRRYKERNDETR